MTVDSTVQDDISPRLACALISGVACCSVGMVTVSEGQIPESFFPCKNCLLVVYRKYPQSEFKIESGELEDRLLISKERTFIGEERVEKITPACRHCKGLYSHSICPHHSFPYRM